MLPPDVRIALGKQLSEMIRMANILSADAHFHYWNENAFTIRADELCAAAQRAAWALARIEESQPEIDDERDEETVSHRHLDHVIRA